MINVFIFIFLAKMQKKKHFDTSWGYYFLQMFYALEWIDLNEMKI